VQAGPGGHVARDAARDGVGDGGDGAHGEHARSIGHDGLAQAEHGGGVVAREQPELARVGVRARDRARVRARVRMNPND